MEADPTKAYNQDDATGFIIEETFNLTEIGRWFVVQIKKIVDFQEELGTANNQERVAKNLESVKIFP